MTLSKRELKTLKRMRKEHLTPSDIPDFDELRKAGMIAPDEVGRTETGVKIYARTFHVTNEYERYVEEHRWFNLEFVIRNIIVPIVVGVSSYIIPFLISA